jgi:type II secretory pathway pseudopilin PulG
MPAVYSRLPVASAAKLRRPPRRFAFGRTCGYVIIGSSEGFIDYRNTMFDRSAAIAGNGRGFTLLTTLIVVSIIALLASVVVVAVDPVRRFAELRNSRRWSDIRSIVDAVYLYTNDHLAYPPGLDENLHQLGTATGGCDIVCGALVASVPLPDPAGAGAASPWWDALAAKTALAQATPTGWLPPDGTEDPGNQWDNEARARDSSLVTYATNAYGGTGWGQYIQLTLDTPVYSNRVRVNADYLDTHINSVEVDVFKDGAWETVFAGGDEATWNTQWVELPFAPGYVSAARFRYNYRLGGYHYWLYEFQFYAAAPVVQPPTPATGTAELVEGAGAVLKGSIVDDGGEPAEYRFQYGQNQVFSQVTPWAGTAATGEEYYAVIGQLQGGVVYDYRAEVRNSGGSTVGTRQSFSTVPPAVGWVAPASFGDPDGRWEFEARAYDGNPMTLARSYHNIGDSQWSSFLHLSPAGAITADAVRLYARGLAQVSQLDLDVELDGVWTDVYQGAFGGLGWIEHSFPAGQVTDARIRFYATVAGEGFHWELNEFQFQRQVETSDAACLDLTPVLVPEYIGSIPVDPSDGTEERTFYAARLRDDRIDVYACHAELGEKIRVAR